MDDVENFDEKKFLQTLGAQVAKVRKSRGYSQDRLCLEAGFARGTLSKIENGLVEPKITTLAKVALTLGVTLRKITDVGLG